MQKSISDFFVEDRHPKDVVAFRGDEVVDIAQFKNDVAWNATRLRAAGCRHGLLASADTYWGAVGILALFHAGADVALPPSLRLDGLNGFLDGGETVVTDRLRSDTHAAFLLEAAPQDSTDAPVMPLAMLDAERCHLDLFTSGSTAQPKRIGKTLRQLESEAQVIETYFAPLLPPGSRIHTTVPYQHLYGLAFGLVWPLFAGRPFNRHSHEIWDTVFACVLRDTVLVSSPAHLTRLAGFSPLDEHQRPALILSAGAALPAAAAADAAAILRQAPTEIFGSTETGAIASRHWIDVDAPWSPLPGVLVEQSAEGLLTVRSPYIAGDQSYLGADLIVMEQDGRFRALGRADDIRKIEGKRVSLSAVEHHLLQLPEIAEAAVLVLEGDHPRLGVVAKLRAIGQQQLGELGAYRFAQLMRRRLAGSLETVSLPKRWRFVDELPKQALGKRKAADLQALFADPAPPKVAGRDEPEVRATRSSAAVIGAVKLELDLYIDPGLSQLDGHFPDLPIVPGVALVDWAARFAARHLDVGDGIVRSLQVKFRRLITPGDIVTLVLDYQPARKRLSFSYHQRTHICASGSFPVGVSLTARS